MITAPEPLEPRVHPVGLTHLLRASYLLRTGASDAAVPHLRLALIYARDSAFIKEQLVRAYLGAGDRDLAKQGLEAALAQHPNDSHLNLLAAEVALRERRYDAAKTHSVAALDETATSRDAAPVLVASLLWAGEVARAVKITRAQLEQHPADAELAMQLAAHLEDHGQLSLAREAYRRARLQRPAQRAPALAEARVLSLSGNFKEAADRLLPLFSHYPDEPQLYAWVARLLDEADCKEADAYWLEAQRLTEGRPRERLGVVVQYLRAGRISEGLATLRDVVVEHPNLLAARLMLARAALRQSDSSGCLNVLADAPSQPLVYFVRARCYGELGELSAALDNLTWAVREAAQPTETLFDGVKILATLLPREKAARKLDALIARARDLLPRQAGLLARALLADAFGDGAGALEIIAQLEPEYVGRASVSWRVAALRAANGRVADATRALEAMVHETPDDPLLLNALGFILADAGVRLAEAEVWLRRAHRLRPDDGYILDSLGWLTYRKSRPAEAVRLLEKAARAADGDPEVLRHLGDAYRASGNAAAAQAAYRAALDAKPPPRLEQLLWTKLREVSVS